MKSAKGEQEKHNDGDDRWKGAVPDDKQPQSPMKSDSFSKSLLQQDDPRQVIALFFGAGDGRGPKGSASRTAFKTHSDPTETKWFAVFRPCSDDSISMMRASTSTGKGLNIKGKSAKKGQLSGRVPFLQISDNHHKERVSTAPPNSRISVFYQSQEACDKARQLLIPVREALVMEYQSGVSTLRAMEKDPSSFEEHEHQRAFRLLMRKMDDPTIREINKYAPFQFGLDVPELLLREAYISRQDIVPAKDWEPGRASEPAFMDMNLHALRDPKASPHVVLLQHDAETPMNPWGLVMAYEEDQVLPVVSDFDPFLFGSTNMKYNSITKEHEDLMKWCLDGVSEILQNHSTKAWTSCWLERLKKEAEKGFHPEIPKYGFGDATSYGVVEDLVKSLEMCGAVRHGAECFNWYFPQDLDTEFLVIWDGFGASTPWKYLSESDLRAFLMERIAGEFSFPMNPAWVVRDKGWHDVLQAQRDSPASQGAISCWYPPASGILEKIDKIHAAHPQGLVQVDTGEDANALEAADLAELELRRHMVLKRAKKKLIAILRFHNLTRKKEAPAEARALQDEPSAVGKPQEEWWNLCDKPCCRKASSQELAAASHKALQYETALM